MEEFRLEVPHDQKRIRLDQFITDQIKQLSTVPLTRNALSQLIERGGISVNGAPATKPSRAVFAKDVIIVTLLPEPKRTAATGTIKLLPDQLVFEHPHFIVINKPAGLLSHPPAVRNTECSVVDLAVAAYPEIKTVGEPLRPGLVHRLDKLTSGLLLVARTEHGYQTLRNCFQQRTITKWYLAVVHGQPPKKGIWTQRIARNPIDPRKMACSDTEGREAFTEFEVISHFTDYSLIKAYPRTGRTHQIRLHAADAGFPVVGDPIYGKKKPDLGRYALHAAELTFTFDGTPYHFTAPLPAELDTFIKTLKDAS